MTITTNNTIKLNLKELSNYSLFNKQAELNENVWNYVQWLNENDFPQSVVDVLLHLGSRSLRVLGISFPKQSTIADSTGLSRQTVSTALKTLTNLGIIDSVRLLNKWRASGKVYRIKPFNSDSLHQHFTSAYGYEINNTNTLTLLNEFEPYLTETCSKDLKKTSTKDSKPSASKDNLYNRLKSLFKARKGSVSNFKAIVSVIYSKMKKLKADASTRLSHAQIEGIMYQSLDALLNMSNVKNELAMLNGIIKNKINDALAPAVSSTSKQQRTELVPAWFESRNSNTSNISNTIDYDAPAVDFEAEKARILAKLE